MVDERRLRTVAVVLAGGLGSRLGRDIPKQLMVLGGRTILERAVAAFDACDAVDEVLVTMPTEWIETARSMLGSRPKPTTVVSGGITRSASTQIALEHLGPDDCLVLVHDAARPLVPRRVIADCIDALRSYDAVVPVIPTNDTIVGVGPDGSIRGALDRDELRRAQTPQAFRLSVLRDAYARAVGDPGFRASDDCSVVIAYRPDVQVVTVPGDERNVKITTPSDLLVAEMLVSRVAAEDRT